MMSTSQDTQLSRTGISSERADELTLTTLNAAHKTRLIRVSAAHFCATPDRVQCAGDPGGDRNRDEPATLGRSGTPFGLELRDRIVPGPGLTRSGFRIWQCGKTPHCLGGVFAKDGAIATFFQRGLDGIFPI